MDELYNKGLLIGISELFEKNGYKLLRAWKSREFYENSIICQIKTVSGNAQCLIKFNPPAECGKNDQTQNVQRYIQFLNMLTLMINSNRRQNIKIEFPSDMIMSNQNITSISPKNNDNNNNRLIKIESCPSSTTEFDNIQYSNMNRENRDWESIYV